METEMINLLLQVPLAGVIVFLVVIFLKHIDANTLIWKGILEDIRKNNDKLYEGLNSKYEGLAKQALCNGENIEEVNDKVETVNTKVETVNGKVDKMDNRLGNIERRLDK